MQHRIHLAFDLPSDHPALFGERKGAFVAPLLPAAAADEAVSFQMVNGTGDGRLVLLAFFAKVGGGHGPQAIEIVQTGDVHTAQIILCHFSVFDFLDAAADLVDQHGEGFKARIHGTLLSC